MTINYPRNLPQEIKFRTSRWGLSKQQAAFEGFNRVISVQPHAAGLNDRFEGVLTTPHLSEADFNTITAFLDSMDGRIGTMRVFNPDMIVPQSHTAATVTGDMDTITGDDDTFKGDVSATPGFGKVNGGMVAGKQPTDGWPNSTVVATNGDFHSIEGHIYKVLDKEVTSDGSGNAAFHYQPLPKNLTDNAPIYTDRPTMIARLQTSSHFHDTDDTKSGAVSFAFEELV